MSGRTIQEWIDSGEEISVYCHNSPHCHHKAILDPLMLRAKLGPDHGAMHDDLVPKLKCSKCGSKKVGLILSPAGNEKRVHNPENVRRNLYAKAKGR